MPYSGPYWCEAFACAFPFPKCHQTVARLRYNPFGFNWFLSDLALGTRSEISSSKKNEKLVRKSPPSSTRGYSNESHEWWFLQLSFRAANNGKNDEGSDNVAVTGSDPGLMGM